MLDARSSDCSILEQRIPGSVVRVLFVCLGNICRSPAAEGVLRALAERRGLALTVDSAGTGAWHAGEPPDRRMVGAARRRGYALEGAARPVHRDDFERFDHIFAMDRSNLEDLLASCPDAHRSKVRLFRALEGEEEDVPDPYYGGSKGFDEVVDVVERCCLRLLDELEE
jgi:protein-tyrosine phosphatase